MVNSSHNPQADVKPSKTNRNKKSREWDKNNKVRANKRKKQWANMNKDKIHAKTQAQHYIKIPNNLLCQRCSLCKAEERHHPDYTKPLFVLFVCKKCHYQIHRELKNMEIKHGE